MRLVTRLLVMKDSGGVCHRDGGNVDGNDDG